MKVKKLKRILAVVMAIIMLLSSAPLGGLVGLDLPDLFKTEASAASISLNRPLDRDYTITAREYYSSGSYHGAIDYGCPKGTPIYAAESGTITIHDGGYGDGYYGCKDGSGWGNYADISHGSGYSTRYAHMSTGRYVVNSGDSVSRGQLIGYSGNSGNSTGPHLHFGLYLNGSKVYPEPYIKTATGYFNSNYTTKPSPVTDLKSEKTVYTTSESINFSWTAVSGATEYWVYLWKDGKQLYSYNCGNNTSFTQAPSSEGKYTMIIRPGNTVGFNDSSPQYSYYVTNKPPERVKDLTADKKVYNTRESVKFLWSSVYAATEYWVYLWKDGKQLYSHNCGNSTSFTQAPSSEGKYTLIIRPGNLNGFNDDSISFSYLVTDSLPKMPTITVPSSNTFSISDSITTNWHEETTAASYRVSLWKGEVKLSQQEITNSTSFTFKPIENGIYVVHVRSENSNGYSEAAEQTYFVGSYNIVYNANSGINAPTKQNKIYGKSIKVSTSIPTRSGYTFKTWNTKADGTGTDYAPGATYSENADLTLYAQWTKNHTHSYTSKTTKSATCTTTGTKTFTCSCGDTYTETIKALGHSYSSSYTTDKAATCTSAGSKSRHCTRSECTAKTDVTAITATGHKYTSKTVASIYLKSSATCTSAAVYYYKCENCSEKGTSTYANGSALGHSYSKEYTVDIKPTCTESGIKTRHCIRCTATTDTQLVPATGHTDKDNNGVCDVCKGKTGSSDNTVTCTCNCHKTGFIGFIWKIINLFNRLFKKDQYCACGGQHW